MKLVDLTQKIEEDMSRLGSLPAPSFRLHSQVSETTPQVGILDICLHIGTHIDAPCHVIEGGVTIDKLPLYRFTGQGVVLGVQPHEDGSISRELLEVHEQSIRPGDIVVLATGWARHWKTESYNNHPYFTEEAAHWLAEKLISIVGIDFLTPEIPLSMRKQPFKFPIHRILLGNDILIVENLADATELIGKRGEFSFLPLPIKGADASPVRAVMAI